MLNMLTNVHKEWSTSTPELHPMVGQRA